MRRLGRSLDRVVSVIGSRRAGFGALATVAPGAEPRSAEAGQSALETALARVPLGADVLLAGMPPEDLRLTGALRDRDCQVRAFWLEDEAGHAWAGGGVSAAPLGYQPTLVLLVNCFSDSQAPAALLVALAHRHPGVPCFISQERAFEPAGAPDLGRRRRPVTEWLIEAELEASGCRRLEAASSEATTWPGGPQGWLLSIALEASGERPGAIAGSACLQAREDALMLDAYRRALSRVRVSADAAEQRQLRDVLDWQAELEQAVALERQAHSLGRGTRRLAGEIVRGLRGVQR